MEAKAPHEQLHKVNHILQAKSYAWNTKNVFIVLLTDFEEFRLFDATIKPDSKNPEQGLIFEFTYDQYLDNIDKLMLLSKEEVESGSIDKLILKDLQSKKLRIPVDKAFLEDLSKWREELAKDIYKQNIKELEDRTDENKVKIHVKILNEAVQKILNRLIFIRIAEDRKIIEPKSLLDEVEWWKAGGKRRNLHKRLTDRFIGWNQDFNGEILKTGPCDVLGIDSHLLAKIIEGLYFPKCPYRFNVIGVELLGSIYERYLGKTIRVTPKRVKIEEKPEVRKAGGVYYTPQYIVDYIVKNTVGKVIKGKTPKQIEKIKILDPACGSGSFLLTAFQTLIDYHLNYYEKHPEESGQGSLFPDIITNYSGEIRLSIEKKALILKNNIFGVDIDPQAVEIAMMSLYLKCLEGEKDLPRKKELLPSLSKNIRCGNSLISYDIFDQLTLFEEEEKDRINPFDWNSKSTGFGEIIEKGGFDVVIGNPPYGAEITDKEKKYLESNYASFEYQINSFVLFIERGGKILKPKGKLSYITPAVFLTQHYFKNIRNIIINKYQIETILLLNYKVFEGADTGDTCIFVFTKSDKEQRIKTKYSIVEGKEIFKNIMFKEKSQDEFTIHKRYEIYLYLNKEIFNKINNISIPLGTIANCIVGIKPYQKGKGNPKQIEKIVKERIFDSDVKKDDIYKKYLIGKDIDRYVVHPIKPRFIKYGGWLAEPRFTAPFERMKIILRQTSDIIRAVLDNDKFYNLNNIYNIELNNDDYNYNYILGILNSKLMVYLYQRIVPEKGKLFAEIKKINLEKLPIRKIDFINPKEKVMHDKMVLLVDKMLELNKKKIVLLPSSKRDKVEREIQITDEKIDELVYRLYGITKEEKKITEREK
ncbi:MAG: N-6 DNA methylase [Candidatus Aminicenantaceae bacterium]